MHDNHNVVLFPKWKTTLEEESLAALKEKRYDEALDKLNKLISYKVQSHEIMIGKLICLMELGHYDDAQDLCEDLITINDENHYQYVHIYLTLLFQTSQYEALIEQVEAEWKMGEIPNPFHEQFQQLYDISQEMNDQLKEKKMTKYIKDLLQAVEQQEHTKQWHVIEKIRKTKAMPVMKLIDPLLTNEQIHPVVKTAIFQWMQEMHVTEKVTIHKSDQSLTVVPTAITTWDKHPIIKQTKLLIGELEQENPTLYVLLEKLIYQYTYVHYPIMPPSEDVPAIADALVSIGKERLNLSVTGENGERKFLYYKRAIEESQLLYLSIIDE
ncbi:tetratricopeptide repeat protein [Lentibacillus sp. N15]|uniref:tetratricopeptide repeat protein n=1 Tax=Lentibacillus songyuanensis TaxID=3136161 RepID=UPI0031BBB7FF